MSLIDGYYLMCLTCYNDSDNALSTIMVKKFVGIWDDYTMYKESRVANELIAATA